MKARTIWLMGGVALVAAGAIAVGWPAFQQTRQAQASTAPVTAKVTTLTAVSSVDSTGAVEPEQTASLSLKTSGTVATVAVKVGDHVKTGDVLMTLDPASVPANVIQAQADLASAKTALDDLLHPSATTLANAQKALADAQATLDKAQRTLRNTQNPAGQSLYDTVDSTKLALDTAQTDSTLASVSADAQSLASATSDMNIAFSRYQDLQAKWDAGDHSDRMYNQLQSAQSAYQSALDKKTQLELRIQSDQANKDATVKTAQKNYDDAVANLNYALKGPDAIKLAQAQADVAVAKSNLADAQDKLNHLKNGAKAEDILSAQVKVQAAHATADSLTLRAPFEGDVLAVNYKPGDPVSPSAAAITLADRSKLHVNASVDETAVGAITSGNPVSLTLDALPGLSLAGRVISIEPFGQTVQGLVRYNVRVDLGQTDPRLLLYMTANTTIVTLVQQDALAVPLTAIQYDSQGNFVNRINTAGARERVNVTTGQAVNDLVVVKGSLKAGDNVEVITAKPATTSTGGFGG
jgi:HlyD family secretion protein